MVIRERFFYAFLREPSLFFCGTQSISTHKLPQSLNHRKVFEPVVNNAFRQIKQYMR